MTEISEKVASATSKSSFGGPAGGSAMTRETNTNNKYVVVMEDHNHWEHDADVISDG